MSTNVFWGRPAIIEWDEEFFEEEERREKETVDEMMMSISNQSMSVLQEQLNIAPIKLDKEINYRNLKTIIMQAPSFSILDEVISDARVDISYFGLRYLEMPDYEGRISIDSLGWRVTDMATNTDYDEAERRIGKKIPKTLLRLYKESEEKLKEKNLITKIFCLFCDLIQYCKELK